MNKNQRYYLKNKAKLLDKMKLRNKQWRIANPELAREKDKKERIVNRANRSQYQRQYSKTHKPDPLKSLARSTLNNAIKLGKIKRPTKCTQCNQKLPVEAHHPDYSKPLEVQWLCIKCHNLNHHPIAVSDQASKINEALK